METVGNRINRRLGEGFFPYEMLYATNITAGKKTNLETEGHKALEYLKENPDMFNFLLISARDRIHETTDISYRFIQQINIVINTGYPPDSINILSPVYQTALNLCPVVTDIDKAIWYIAFSYYFETTYLHPENSSIKHEMIYAWLYLLLYVQNKEMISRLTIDIDNYEPSIGYLSCLLDEWYENGVAIKRLSDQEIIQLNSLITQRETITKEVEKEIASAVKVAEQTSEQWILFLDLVNDIQEKERFAVSHICAAETKREKKNIVNDYEYKLLEISRGRYTLNKKEIQLLPLFETILKRFREAYVHCTVKTDTGDPFVISPAVNILSMFPNLTFNYLLLSFHRFRLQPNKENTIRFINLALSCLLRNLGVSFDYDLSSVKANADYWLEIEQKVEGITSLDDKVICFFESIVEFIKENQAAIDQLSFRTIQEDSSSILFFKDDSNNKYEFDWIHKEIDKEMQKFDQIVDDVLNGKSKPHNHDEVQQKLKDYVKISETATHMSLARQIITSLNIIYMFCGALQIIISHSIIHFRNQVKIQEYYYKLQQIDAQLVCKVYSHLSEQEIGMFEYRDKKGFNPAIISSQELKSEQFLNDTISGIFINFIEESISNIENDNIDQLLATKNQVKERILQYPDCDAKEQYIPWLDNISEKISNCLIKKCKENNRYLQHKEEIKTSLGNKCNYLPTSTIDSLTTAEMLFEEYANEEYAKHGFDFSCISALYYQAFENAYNSLLWSGYANKLNNCLIGNMLFTDVLDKRRNDYGMGAFTPAEGYLPNEASDRKFYVSYKNKHNPKTRVNERCMYKSFGIIMEQIRQNSDLPKFCDYFADIAGFNNSADMCNDSEYMKICMDFSAKVKNSADYRNNASHGGSLIDLNQCSKDKKTILNNLEEVRKTSIGLIQLLLFLLFSHVQ